jgi:outer membrane autotransporter protein
MIPAGLRRRLLLGTAVCALNAGVANVALATCLNESGGNVDISACSNGALISSAITGSLTNSGNISIATGAAVVVEGNVGNGVTNSGTISGSRTGMLIGGSIGGVLTNSGTITSTGTNDGIKVSGTVGGGVTNSGTITGGIASGLEIDGSVGATVVNAAGGSISSFLTGILITGSVAGDVTNAGRITTQSGDALLIDGTIAGDLVNSDTISSQSQRGIVVGGTLTSGSAVVQNVTNTGAILGQQYGIELFGNVGGNIYDDGTITGSDVGLYVEGNVGGSITLGSDTVINTSNGGYGIYIAGSVGGAAPPTGALHTGIFIGGTIAGGITNDGVIHAGKTGIYDATSIDGSIVNAGQIVSNNDGGIKVVGGVSGDVVNATGAAITAFGGTGIYVGGDVGGNLVAGGTITTPDVGIYVGGNVVGSIVNSSTIEPTAGYGVAVGLGAGNANGDTGIYVAGTVGTGGLVNSGAIESDTGHAAVVVGSGSLNLSNTGTIIGGNGIALDYTAATAASTITEAGGLIQGDIDLAQADTVDLAGGAIDGAINGSAATVDVTGTFTTGGTMDVGAIQVANGGRFTLANDVTVANALTNDGTLEVDTQQTITGNYVQGSDGTLTIGVGTSSTGELTVTNDTTFDSGSKLELVVLGSSTPAVGETFTIVSTDGTADYGGITVDVANPFLDLSGTTTVSGNNLIVTLTADDTELTQAVSNTDSNTRSSAAFLEQAIAQLGQTGTPMLTAINAFLSDTSGPLTTEQKVQLVARQLTPHTAALNASTTQQFSSGATGAVVQHVETARAADNGDATGLAAGSDTQSSAFWGQALGVMSRNSGDQDTAGAKTKTVGGALGGDTLVTPRIRVGGAFAYGNSVVDGLGVLGAGESSHVDSYQLSAYGSYNGGRWYVDGQLGLGLDSFDQGRQSVGLGGTARSKYDGTNVVTHLDGGYDFQLGRTKLTPTAALTYTHEDVDGYTERGTVASDHVAGMSYDSVQTELGAQATWQIPLANGRLVPTAKIGWLHDWIRSPFQTETSLDTGGSQTTYSDRPTADGIDLGLAATFYSLGNWDLQGQYDGNFYHGYTSNAAVMTLKVHF